MTNLIDDLINDAGFSSTYERDRLKKLCQLSALYCVSVMLTVEDKTKCIAEIISSFNSEFDHEQDE